MTSLSDIKKTTLRAIMSDSLLMHSLILKGGNALQLAYNITNRGSVDIDFSMNKDFTDDEYKRLSNQFNCLLNNEFNKIGLEAYDVKFKEKPKSGAIAEWKGYSLEFKLIDKDIYLERKEDIDWIRRNSIKVNGQSTKYTVDISSYEYTESYIQKDIDGLILKVYTPEMIVIEKIRALCQSMKGYREIVPTANQKERARDIYDIWNVCHNFPRLNLTKELFVEIFKAKRVPLSFLSKMEDLRDTNLNNWEVVQSTIAISDAEDLKDYNFYFDHLLDIIKPFIDHKPLG